MNRYFSIILFYFLMISCSQNQNPSHVEKDYIRSLEEKNRALEKELQKLRSKSESFDIPQGPKQETKNPKNCFTIGSTEDQVI